jgi:hypothetical protein
MEVSKKLIPSLFINLKVAIAMGSNLMAFLMNDLNNLWAPLCNISQNKEGGLCFKTTEKGKDFFHIG